IFTSPVLKMICPVENMVRGTTIIGRARPSAFAGARISLAWGKHASKGQEGSAERGPLGPPAAAGYSLLKTSDFRPTMKAPLIGCVCNAARYATRWGFVDKAAGIS